MKSDEQVPKPGSGAHEMRITRRTAFLFGRMLKNFLGSEVRGPALAMFAALIALLVAINGLNILNSYVGRDFMTAIAERNMPGFVRQTLLYVVVFGALTVASVVVRFTEERLGLLWRAWLTRRMVSGYIDQRIYYRLGSEITNPDQRIADDVRTLTVTSLSFFLMLCNATLTIIAFSGVLWSISPLLFGVAVLYAAGGSVLTVLLGRPLVWLNFTQSDKEAYLRSSLIHLRDNAEPIALLQREGRVKARVLRNVDDLTRNLRRIIAVNRNVSFFTTGYNYFVQIIPALIVAPLFIRGRVEFGVITQSSMAFSQLLGAFSLIVNQFSQISSYAAVVARIGSFGEVAEDLQTATLSSIQLIEAGDRVAYEDVTLLSAGGTPLVSNLNVSLARGTNVFVSGANEAGQTALLRATAGIAGPGTGRITRPASSQLLVVSERPYLPPGTLRQAILRTGQEATIGDERIEAVLDSLGLGGLTKRLSGLDVELEWETALSEEERQLVAVTRVLFADPMFVLLDRLHRSLDDGQLARVLTVLGEKGTTYVLFGDDEARHFAHYCAAELVIENEGRWSWKKSDHAAAPKPSALIG